MKLAARGARGIIGLGRNFRIMDDNRSGSLDKYEFSKGMSDFAVSFTTSEIEALFRFIDVNNDGVILYDEFLRAVRGPLKKNREVLVLKAFDILDRDGNGVLELSDLKGVYSGAKHPLVISGEKTEKQVLLEFLETFEVHHNTMHGNKSDGEVTKEEFLEYYSNVSSSIDRDDYF
jgi:Ca2+-binding EF-hand superfamily protein